MPCTSNVKHQIPKDVIQQEWKLSSLWYLYQWNGAAVARLPSEQRLGAKSHGSLLKVLRQVWQADNFKAMYVADSIRFNECRWSCGNWLFDLWKEHGTSVSKGTEHIYIETLETWTKTIIVNELPLSTPAKIHLNRRQSKMHPFDPFSRFVWSPVSTPPVLTGTLWQVTRCNGSSVKRRIVGCREHMRGCTGGKDNGTGGSWWGVSRGACCWFSFRIVFLFLDCWSNKLWGFRSSKRLDQKLLFK